MASDQPLPPAHDAAPDDSGPQGDRTTWVVASLALIAAGGLLWAVTRPTVAPPPPPPQWSEIAPPADSALRPWRWIVIHHSATPGGTAQGIDRYHEKVQRWDGIGYHFVIGNGQPMPLGRIEATFRWRSQQHGAHAGARTEQRPYNLDGIGICVIGDFDKTAVDPRLERRLAELCALLVEHVPTLTTASVVGHNQVPGKETACPGAKLSVEAIVAQTRMLLAQRGLPGR